jgi:AraC-like DNA-binding protein
VDICTLGRETAGFEGDAFPLALHREVAHPSKELHRHDYTELVIVTGGQGLHVTDDLTYPLTAGEVFVVNGRQAHGYAQTRNLDIVNILFDLEGLHLPLYDLRELLGFHLLFSLDADWVNQDRLRSRLCLSHAACKELLPVVDRLEEALSRPARGRMAAAAGVFLQLITWLSQKASAGGEEPRPELRRLSGALAMMEKRYAEPLQLVDLCRFTHMSRSAFTQLFSEAMGVSPIAYLIDLRVREAARLLRETHSSMSEIATRVGFTDSNYLSRRFRQRMHCTPSAYRGLWNKA